MRLTKKHIRVMRLWAASWKSWGLPVDELVGLLDVVKPGTYVAMRVWDKKEATLREEYLNRLRYAAARS